MRRNLSHVVGTAAAAALLGVVAVLVLGLPWAVIPIGVVVALALAPRHGV
jgi:hypothetical protein